MRLTEDPKSLLRLVSSPRLGGVSDVPIVTT